MSEQISHNPDDLTEWGQSQGWRLLDKDERFINKLLPSLSEIELWDSRNKRWNWSGWMGNESDGTYRTKLTREQLAEKRGLRPVENIEKLDLNPDLLNIPKEIQQAADLIEKYAAMNGWENWEFDGIEKRGLGKENLDRFTNRHRKQVERLTAQIAELIQQLTDIKREWISVKYKLPSGREEVLYFDGEEVGTFMPEIGIDSEYGSAERCSKFGVTHWMPFPKPPTP